MVDFSIYPLPEPVKSELLKLKIDFVFQPIRNIDWEIVAYEALMRPEEGDVISLIDEYHKEDKLHVLEVATFFGAHQAYEKRGYTENICVNSFPEELMTEEEGRIFMESFPNSMKNGIVEVIDFPIYHYNIWEKKREILQREDTYFAMGDFGVGIRDMKFIEENKPNLVKLDRTLVWDIEDDVIKQANCRLLTEAVHEMGVMVLAEGIETQEAMDYLKSVGVELFQGYFIGRPE